MNFSTLEFRTVFTIHSANFASKEIHCNEYVIHATKNCAKSS